MIAIRDDDKLTTGLARAQAFSVKQCSRTMHPLASPNKRRGRLRRREMKDEDAQPIQVHVMNGRGYVWRVQGAGAASGLGDLVQQQQQRAHGCAPDGSSLVRGGALHDDPAGLAPRLSLLGAARPAVHSSFLMCLSACCYDVYRYDSVPWGRTIHTLSV